MQAFAAPELVTPNGYLVTQQLTKCPTDLGESNHTVNHLPQGYFFSSIQRGGLVISARASFRSRHDGGETYLKLVACTAQDQARRRSSVVMVADSSRHQHLSLCHILGLVSGRQAEGGEWPWVLSQPARPV
jgi:hypothetical protein